MWNSVKLIQMTHCILLYFFLKFLPILLSLNLHLIWWWWRVLYTYLLFLGFFCLTPYKDTLCMPTYVWFCFYLGPSINGLVTDENTMICCRGFILALFQSPTANITANMPIWVPYGLPIWDPYGKCDRVRHGSHMGKPICRLHWWVPYNSPIKKKEMI